MTRVRLAERLGDRDNNFDVVRLVTAWAVLVSHSFALVGEAEPLHQLGTTLGATGVLVFFAISGLLIRSSWERDPVPPAYVRKRFLRLWPALTVVTVATALLLGPLVSQVSLRAYFSSWETWTYPLWILLMTPFGAELPGVFTHLPQARAVNGSLWTLQVEVLAYLLLLALGTTGLLRSRAVVSAIAIAAIAWAGLLAAGGDPSVGTACALAAFAVGACAYSWREHVVLSHRGAAVVVVACLVSGLGPDAGRVLVWTPAAAYLAFWAAYDVPPLGRRLTRWGDASYGLYIYAFPVQQTIVQVLGPGTPPLVVVAVATPVVWLLAVASWRLVERPALRHAPRSRVSPAAARPAGFVPTGP